MLISFDLFDLVFWMMIDSIVAIRNYNNETQFYNSVKLYLYIVVVAIKLEYGLGFYLYN